jgi:predicted DNA-binding protein with PD1-like motif
MRTIALRLRPGADLKAELLALPAREGVRAGWALTCVGTLSQVRVRLAGGAEHATWHGMFEIVALTGTLSQDGGHLHLAVADQQGRTLGGHLAEGCTVRTTAEVVLAADDRLLLPASTILPPATTSWGSRARPVGRGLPPAPRNPGPFDPAATGLWRHA